MVLLHVRFQQCTLEGFRAADMLVFLLIGLYGMRLVYNQYDSAPYHLRVFGLRLQRRVQGVPVVPLLRQIVLKTFVCSIHK